MMELNQNSEFVSQGAQPAGAENQKSLAATTFVQEKVKKIKKETKNSTFFIKIL